MGSYISLVVEVEKEAEYGEAIHNRAIVHPLWEVAVEIHALEDVQQAD